jgi:hypothetical protein
MDQMDFRDALLERMKKGGDLYPIKNRVILKNVLERLQKEAKEGLSAFTNVWRKRKDPWNVEE